MYVFCGLHSILCGYVVTCSKVKVKRSEHRNSVKWKWESALLLIGRAACAHCQRREHKPEEHEGSFELVVGVPLRTIFMNEQKTSVIMEKQDTKARRQTNQLEKNEWEHRTKKDNEFIQFEHMNIWKIAHLSVELQICCLPDIVNAADRPALSRRQNSRASWEAS